MEISAGERMPETASSLELPSTSASPVRAEDIEYTGYEPKATTDFVLQPVDDASSHFSPISWLPEPLRPPDSRSNHRPAIVFIVICAIGAILSLVLGLTSVSCKLSLCDKPDYSSLSSSTFLFIPIDFTAPLQTILVTLSGAFIALGVLSIVLKVVSSAKLADPPLSVFAAHIRYDALAFTLNVSLAACAIAVPIFLLVGFLSGWNSAVAFLLGLIPTLFASAIAVSVTTRAAPRAATVAGSKSVLSTFAVVTRAAAVAPLASHGLTYAALVLTYLILRNVNVLPGFIFGVASAALVLRVVSAIYAAPPISALASGFGPDDARNPAAPIPSSSTHVAAVAAHVAEVCLLFATPVVATAILGSSLAYFEANPYAMCVLNHLAIDQACVAYRYPSEKQSFAVSLCRQTDFYLSYPSLTRSQSNSTFVALPFLLGLLAIINMMSSSLISLRKQKDPQGRLDLGENTHVNHTLLRPLLAQMVVDQVVRIFICSVSTIVLLLLFVGPRSSYTRANSVSLERYQLPMVTPENVGTLCEPISAPNSGLPSDVYPRLELVSGVYEPIDAFGTELPTANKMVWHVFVCMELGLLCGVLVAILCAYVASATNGPAQKASALASDGFDGEVAAAASGGALGSALAATIVIATCLSCYRILRAYGVGIGAIGLMCSLGPASEMGVISHIGKEARRLCVIMRLPRLQGRRTDVIAAAGDLADGWSKGVLTACAAFTTLSMGWVLMLLSGVAPSAREVSGVTVDRLPTRHATDIVSMDLLDIELTSAVFQGIALPFLMCACTALSATYVSRSLSAAVTREIRRRGVWESAGIGTYQACSSKVAKAASMASVAPILFGLVSALGCLWYGVHAWIGLLIGAIASGCVLSFFTSLLGNRLQSARLLQDLNWGEEETTPHHAREEGFWKWNEVSEEWVSGCIRVFLVILATGGALSAHASPTNRGRWWLFFAMGAVWIIMFSLSHAVMSRFISKLTELRSTDREGENFIEQPVRVNPHAVSPYYEQGPSVRFDTMSYESALRQMRIENGRELTSIFQ